MLRSLPGVVLAHASAVYCAGCTAPLERRVTEADYPGVLRPVESLGADVLWQQRVTAAWGDGEERGFDAAVQKLGDTLTVIGLSSHGGAGFVIELRNGVVELTNDTGMEVPFPPRFVVLDVQRVFYPWLPLDRAPRDGTREDSIDGELIRERWTNGRLVERRFVRASGEPRGTIRVVYDWGAGAPGSIAPLRARLENGWLGYRLEVDTHAETMLKPTSP